MKPRSSTLPSSNRLVATVVPWLTAATSSPVAPSRARTFSTPVRKPFAGSAGVDGVLVVTTSPLASSTATTPVEGRPVSMPIRMLRSVRPGVLTGGARTAAGDPPADQHADQSPEGTSADAGEDDVE